MTLTSPWRKPLLIVHIVASVSLIGTGIVLVALGISSVRGADPRTVYPAAYLIEAWIVAPLAVIALGTGILQAVGSGRGLLRYWWVAIKLATTTTFAVLVLTVLIPRLATSADAATAGETFTTGERLTLAVVPALAVTLLVLNVALAIYQPPRRLRTTRRARRAVARSEVRANGASRGERPGNAATMSNETTGGR